MEAKGAVHQREDTCDRTQASQLREVARALACRGHTLLCLAQNLSQTLHSRILNFFFFIEIQFIYNIILVLSFFKNLEFPLFQNSFCVVDFTKTMNLSRG